MKIDTIPDKQIDPISSAEQFQPNANNHQKLSKISRRNIFRLGTFLLILFAYFNWDHVSDAYTVITYDGDTKIVTLSNDAGMNLKGKALFFSNSPELVGTNELHEHCPMEDEESVEYGCYIPSEDKIYILEVTTEPFSEAAASTAAHEMLHAVWEDLSNEDRINVSNAIASHLESKNDAFTTSVAASLALYDESASVQIDEAHSFIGSELDEIYTDDLLDDHYGKYFADRNKSASANARFRQGVESIEKDIEVRKQALEEKFNEISEYEAKWLTPFDAALDRDLYYGNYTSYNRNVESYNNNLEIYNGKVDEYEKMRSQFNEDVDEYNKIMESMMPDKQLEGV